MYIPGHGILPRNILDRCCGLPTGSNITPDTKLNFLDALERCWQVALLFSPDIVRNKKCTILLQKLTRMANTKNRFDST